MLETQDFSPWLTLAGKYLGTQELINGNVNPFVTQCFMHTDYHTKANEPWCAAFTCFVLENSGCKSSHNASAVSNTTIGVPCPDDMVGAICVWRHKSGPLKNHFHTNILKQKLAVGRYLCRGGNQNNEVNDTVYSTVDLELVSTRWPLKADGTTMPQPPKEGLSNPAIANPPLSWEKGRPDRATWSAELYARLNEKWDSFAKATDAPRFHRDYNSMPRDQKVHIMAEMFVWTAYYESGWQPKESSVDVGTAHDRDTWSVGLLQLSVCDQPNLHLPTNYGFSDLEDPVKNLHLGVLIMANQIEKRELICIPAGGKGLYWATLHPGGKYDKTSTIAAHTGAIVL